MTEAKDITKYFHNEETNRLYNIMIENIKHNNAIRRRKQTVEKNIEKLLKEYFSLNIETMEDTEKRIYQNGNLSS